MEAAEAYDLECIARRGVDAMTNFAFAAYAHLLCEQARFPTPDLLPATPSSCRRFALPCVQPVWDGAL